MILWYGFDDAIILIGPTLAFLIFKSDETGNRPLHRVEQLLPLIQVFELVSHLRIYLL